MTTANKPTAKFPSFNWMRGVAREKRINVIHRFILVQLCIYRDEKRGGLCDPGYRVVAKDLGVDRKTVMGAVDEAVRFGWMLPPVKGRRENLKFIFTFPTDQEVRSGGTSRDDQEVRPERTSKTDQEVRFSELRSPSEGVKKSVKKVPSPTKSKASSRHGHLSGKEEERAVEYISEPPDFASRDSKEDATSNPDRKTDQAGQRKDASSLKPDLKKGGDENNASTFSDAEIDAAFAEFYAACPKKVGPIATRREYHAAVVKRGVDPAKVLAAIKRYAVEVEGLEPRRIKNPANWLRDGYYDNEPLPGTGGPPTIDQDGNVIEQPSPRRSRPQTFEEAAEELHAEIKAGRR